MTATTTAHSTEKSIGVYTLLLWLQVPLLLGGIYWAVGWTLTWLDQPLENLSLEGVMRQVDQVELRNRVWLEVDQPYLDIDLGGIKKALESHPWIHEVEVRRQWPAGLRVQVREQIPVARWGNSGLLNSNGQVFVPTQADGFESLPQFHGPENRALAMMVQFRALNQQMRPLQLQLTALELEPRGAWSLTLDNDIRLLLGRGDLNAKVKRFSRVYDSQLVRHVEKIKQIDVRYTNGLTVTWRDPSRVSS